MDLRKAIEIAISYEQKNIQEIGTELGHENTSSSLYLQNKLIMHKERNATLRWQLWCLNKQLEKFDLDTVKRIFKQQEKFDLEPVKRLLQYAYGHL